MEQNRFGLEANPLYKGKIKTNLPSHFHSTVKSHGDASWANNTGTIEKLIIENIEIILNMLISYYINTIPLFNLSANKIKSYRICTIDCRFNPLHLWTVDLPSPYRKIEKTIKITNSYLVIVESIHYL